MDAATIAVVSANRVALRAEELKDLVKRRALTYEVAEMYDLALKDGETDSARYDRLMATLGSIVEDFKQVYDSVQDQSIERKVVSMACLLAMTNAAAESHFMPAFSNAFKMGRKRTPGKFFILEVIAPMTGCNINENAYYSATKSGDFFVDIERNLPGMAPCFIETFNIDGFSDLKVPQKYGVIAHIESKNVILSEVKAAYGKYLKYGPGELDRTELKDYPPFTDVYINGVKMTEIREDGYVNATNLADALRARARTQDVAKAQARKDSRPLFNDYIKVTKNRAFVLSFGLADGTPSIFKPINSTGSIWIHPKIAVHLAKWKGLDDLAAALEGYMDNTVPIESTVVTPDRVEIRPIEGEGFSTQMRTFDGYCDLTSLGASLGENINNLRQREALHAVEAEIALARGIPERDVVLATIGRYSSVWGHPDVAIHLVETYRPKARASFIAAMREPPSAVEVYTTIRDAAGQIITRQRASDGYLDSNLIEKWVQTKGVKTRMDEFLLFRRGLPTALEGADLEKHKSDGLYGSLWIHPAVAAAFAQKGGVDTLGDLVAQALNTPVVEAFTWDPQLNVKEPQEPSVAAGPSKASGSMSEEQPADPVTYVRKEDGYVNATTLCKLASKLWTNFIQLAWTSKYMAELERMHREEVMIEEADDGVWVHPKLSLRLFKSPRKNGTPCLRE